MNQLKFSYNWNNKLDCKAFTTLRLSDRFKVGQQYEIILKDESKGIAMVKDVRYTLLNQINEFVARIDTGYSMGECRNILTRMYKNKNVDWETKRISLILLVYIEPKTE